MAIPKKNVNVISQKELNSERVHLVNRIRENESFLPKGILHEDLDRGFVDFVNNDLKLNIDGNGVPVLFISLQNWNEFTKTWQFADKYKNVQMPFITIVRSTNINLNEQMKYNIPYLFKKDLLKVPVWNGNRNGYDIYEIPQPVRINISYDVTIFSTRIKELNRYNKVMLTRFSSNQAYTTINGHYIPIKLDGVSSDNQVDMMSKKFYKQTYKLVQEGLLLDENNFIIKPAVNRTILGFNVNGSVNPIITPTDNTVNEFVVNDYVEDYFE
jgi:hypothetical protein